MRLSVMATREEGGGSKNDLLALAATWVFLPPPSSFTIAYFAESFVPSRSLT